MANEPSIPELIAMYHFSAPHGATVVRYDGGQRVGEFPAVCWCPFLKRDFTENDLLSYHRHRLAKRTETGLERLEREKEEGMRGFRAAVASLLGKVRDVKAEVSEI